MKLVEISTNLQWIIKWKNRGCTTLDDVSRIDPNDPELKKYQAEVQQFRKILSNPSHDGVIRIFFTKLSSVRYKFNPDKPLAARGIFM